MLSVVAPALSRPALAQDFERGLYVPFGNGLSTTTASGAQVIASGNVVVAAPDCTIAATVDAGGAMTSFASSLELRAALAIEISASTAGDFRQTLASSWKALPAFTAAPGVVVTPYALVRVEIDGRVEAGLRTSLVQEVVARVDVSSSGGAPVVALVAPPRPTQRVARPTALGATPSNVRAVAHAGVLFRVAVSGFPIGGPYVEATIGSDQSVQPLALPWWDLDGLLALGVGWDLASAAAPPELTATLARSRYDLAASSEPFAPAAGDPTRWSRVYDLVASNDEVRAVLPRANGDLFAIGNTALAHTWIARLTFDGAVASEKVGTLASAMGPKDACTTADGGIAAAGFTSTISGMRVDRYDAAGNPLWSRVVSDPLGDLVLIGAAAIAPTASNGVVVAGSGARLGATPQIRGLLVELDASGSILSTREVHLGPAAGDARLIDVAVAPDGSLVAVGTINYTAPGAPPPISNGNALVVRFDPAGAVAWSRILGATGNDAAISVAIGSDGSVLIGGSTAVGAHKAWLACLEGDGALRWSANYAGESVLGSAGDTGFDSIQGVSPLDDGAFLAVGTTGNAAQKDAWIFS
ncbi:MAG TPA: hypothetical protein VKE69_15345, partial [Planctomycetota bacterium]|nr:hypothetical protein [Planctomycetota bacterium]